MVTRAPGPEVQQLEETAKASVSQADALYSMEEQYESSQFQVASLEMQAPVFTMLPSYRGTEETLHAAL